jgi:3-oxoacyl-[acyl-carrier-protein] synthase-1
LLTQNNKDGFVPGEAASFIVLTRHAHHALNKQGNLIKIHNVGINEEAGHLNSDNAYRGDGLDKAFKKALLHCNGLSINKIYSSINGESYWSKEQGVAIIRNKKHFCDEMRVEHPADCYGDVACATGSSLIALSALALLEENAEPKAKQQEAHLVYSSSDGPSRAAVVLEKITCDASLNTVS